jgi:hypothetical protein
MANFTMSMDTQQAATQAQVYSGLFVSLCTLMQPSGNVTVDGAPDNTFTQVAGLINIPCMDAVLAPGNIEATEARELEEIMSKSYRHIMLNGYYPQCFISASGKSGAPAGWQAVVDGVTYNLLGAEPDSQNTQTRLKCQLVTL